MISQISSLDSALHFEGLTIVDFWAPWCGPCQEMGATLEEIVQEYNGNLKIYKVNLEDNFDLANKYQILNIPTLLFFREGRPIRDLVGVNSKYKIKKTIDSLI